MKTTWYIMYLNAFFLIYKIYNCFFLFNISVTYILLSPPGLKIGT
jgi:hypothetical protein